MLFLRYLCFGLSDFNKMLWECCLYEELRLMSFITFLPLLAPESMSLIWAQIRPYFSQNMPVFKYLQFGSSDFNVLMLMLRYFDVIFIDFIF